MHTSGGGGGGGSGSSGGGRRRAQRGVEWGGGGWCGRGAGALVLAVALFRLGEREEDVLRHLLGDERVGEV